MKSKMITNMPQKSCSVFVSHAASESDLVHDLVDHLERILPSLKFFVSSSYMSLKPGAVWWDEIQKNLKDVKVILACVSRQSASKPWILFESGIGLGREAILVPVILDDLPTSKLGPPLSMFQAFRIDDSQGFEHLIDQIAAATGVQVERSLIEKESSLLTKKVSSSNDLSMGFYAGLNRKDITTGWERYGGNLQFPDVCKDYLSFGSSSNNAFRYPPDDTLNAPWQYWGFRIRSTFDVHIYVVIRLIEGTIRKIYASSNHNSWGFTGNPTDEFRVPLERIPNGKWQVIIVDVQSLEDDFPQPIKTIIGARVRGPLQLSHIWCVKDLKQIPNKFRSIAKLISYPR